MTDLAESLNISRKRIDRALDGYLPPARGTGALIHKAMRYSVFSGGKRIRPIIVLEACRACTAPGTKSSRRRLRDALTIGCAVEMAHAYSLIHDDLPSMDDDDYRRGKPSCHKAFGEANAILAGDALLTLAFNTLSTHLGDRTGIEAARELSLAIGTYGMVGGQAMDIGCGGSPASSARKGLIDRLKTARLFEASARLGAIAAGASKKKIAALASFGSEMGAAFQAIDDMIDKDGHGSGARGARAAGRAEDMTRRAIRAIGILGRAADRLKEISYLMLRRSV